MLGLGSAVIHFSRLDSVLQKTMRYARAARRELSGLAKQRRVLTDVRQGEYQEHNRGKAEERHLADTKITVRHRIPTRKTQDEVSLEYDGDITFWCPALVQSFVTELRTSRNVR